MIEIDVELMGTLRVPKDRKRKTHLSFKEPLTVNDLLDYYKFTPNEKKLLVVLVNKVKVNSDHILKDKDKIFITFPLGGG